MTAQGSVPTEKLEDVRVTGGSRVPGNAEISVVVMATNATATVAEAVRSLISQDTEAEIVVVNTGTGSVRERLAAEQDFIVIVETACRQYPGGTRNLGIKYSRAPIVAFLAADCMAAPGWLRHRLAAHRAGSKAVSSALLPAPDGGDGVGTVAWAVYLGMHASRMPDVPAENANRFGASYARDLFEEFGLFREDLRVSEDAEFNNRIGAYHEPVWNPEIITFHRYPATLAGALRDQFVRGRRAAAFQALSRSVTPLRLFRSRRKHRIRIPKQYVRKYCHGPRQEAMLRARHLLPLLALSHGLGALSLYLYMPRKGYGEPHKRPTADQEA